MTEPTEPTFSERLYRLADNLFEDFSQLIECGYAPSNQFNEHLLELQILAKELMDDGE